MMFGNFFKKKENDAPTLDLNTTFASEVPTFSFDIVQNFFVLPIEQIIHEVKEKTNGNPFIIANLTARSFGMP
jgi:hypothetical protein